MKTTRRDILRSLLPCVAMAGALLMAGPATAADPVAVPKQMRIVVPYAPGGSTDLLARNIAAALSKRLGNTVIVENRPGAGSLLGTDHVAKAAPDGSTLLLTTSALTINAGLKGKLPFDPVADLAPLAMLSEVPMILAVPADSPYKTTADLVNAARARPGTLNFGSSGIGSSNHLAMELFNAAGKLKITHVPYKGMAPAALDLSSGQVQAIIGTYSSLAGVMKTGKVRALAVSSLTPSPFSPELPPIAATLPGYNMTGWFAMLAPAKTPPALLELLHKEIRTIITSDDFTKFFANERAVASQMDLPTLKAVVRDEVGQWKRIATEQNIQID